MKVADIYIRVSTDEQADKGYSQRSQEEVLRRYCEINNISIRKTIFEDHSAKTFVRPQWQGLLLNLRKQRGKIDLILFTKWDRFSRNAPDAYQMINTLKILGVEPQAIEQPLDMEVPENKMMLAIYLTAPEIENDRRALNTFYGLRRARKEGRWVSHAPVGYINRHDATGKKYIAIDPPQAKIMEWAFNEIAKGIYSTQQVYEKAAEMGLKCKRNNFYVAVRNPVYCGKILIVKYKDEAAHTVKGLHDGIISESLFYDVQDVLSGKKREEKTKVHSPDMLPLRGFIKCSRCNRILCGSASKGRNGYYYYYHCSSACGCRYKAEEVNKVFDQVIEEFTIQEEYADLFTEVIRDTYKNQNTTTLVSRSELLKEINELNNRTSKARELLLNGDIDGADYKTIKSENEYKVNVLEAKLSEAAAANSKTANIEPLLRPAISKLTRLNTIYSKSDSSNKRELIGSMYPQKFTFEELQHRTALTSELYSCIYLINSEIKGKKEGQATDFSCLPILAPEAGLEPATL
ncbi:DNA invertase Pin-like site-specific DNA recombinase [Mucilaginibacter gracilis]|uniref:Resolvase domain-containing protein n=2 Tax=Mucilaginibacter TaxID=423349 RepID=H1YIL2_9SPHI|nr:MULTISPECIES: recombinase family protein [Mucilaginibacter]EHQ26578.1 Resolvase domain-containing protein [Mucilaginibacter paludis DSM 18603]RKR80502.1 DNA invertase Pin-like site-specific DNA recombinase [Mucilaginibacter gracilis]